jgi:hypothetical protein
MNLRFLGTSALTIALAIGAIGTAKAGTDNGNGNGGLNNGNQNGRQVPELDPIALGGGILLLAGGVLMLHERRRSAISGSHSGSATGPQDDHLCDSMDGPRYQEATARKTGSRLS